jgi:PAS domain S-box-containing protein
MKSPGRGDRGFKDGRGWGVGKNPGHRGHNDGALSPDQAGSGRSGQGPLAQISTPLLNSPIARWLGSRIPGIHPLLEDGGRLEHNDAARASLLTLSYKAMFAWGLDGPIEFWNSGAERLYGFSSDEAVGRSSHALLQTKFPTDFAELRSHLQNGRYWSGELRHVCKDGREVIVDSRMQLLGDNAVLEVNRDVTERKRIEAELGENEQRLRWLASIVESSDDAIVSKSLDGVITSWNRGAERVFGYTAEEAVGQPITIVIPQDRQDEERTILTRIRRGERVDHFETVRQRKHGSLIVVSLTISPVRNAGGKIVGASKIARDITEQKRSQEQIATLAGEAEHRSKNLLANVQAIVNLSQASDVDDLKRAIEGRIKALANVHSLFVEARWIGAELSTIATKELAPYFATGDNRVRIDGPQVMLEPASYVDAVAVSPSDYAFATGSRDGTVRLWSPGPVAGSSYVPFQPLTLTVERLEGENAQHGFCRRRGAGSPHQVAKAARRDEADGTVPRRGARRGMTAPW